MPFPARLLNEGEHVVASTRSHVKVLIGRVLVLLLIMFGAAFVAAVVVRTVDPGTGRLVIEGLLAVVALAAVAKWVVGPFVRWFTTTYTFTNRRFIQRSGLMAKTGRTIPLNRISGVDFDIGVTDRLFGCGTLVVSDASEQGRVLLHDIPHVEELQRQVAEELHRLSIGGRPSDDGT